MAYGRIPEDEAPAGNDAGRSDREWAVPMHASARTIRDVYDSLSVALDDLDSHGHAMAALHLAMAVDCLRSEIDGHIESAREPSFSSVGPRLRIVASSS